MRFTVWTKAGIDSRYRFGTQPFHVWVSNSPQLYWWSHDFAGRHPLESAPSLDELVFGDRIGAFFQRHDTPFLGAVADCRFTSIRSDISSHRWLGGLLTLSGLSVAICSRVLF